MSDFSLVIPDGVSSQPVYGTTSGININIGATYRYRTTATGGGTDYTYGTVPDVTVTGVHDDELVYMAVCWKKIIESSEICHWFQLDPEAPWINGTRPTTTSYVDITPTHSSGSWTPSGATQLRVEQLTSAYNDKNLVWAHGMYGHTYLDESDWKGGPYWTDTTNTSGYYNDYNRVDGSGNPWSFDPFSVINENASDCAYIMFRGPGRYIKQVIQHLIFYDASWKRGLTALENIRAYEIPFTIGIRTETTNTVWSNPAFMIDSRFESTYSQPISTLVSNVPFYTINTGTAYSSNITYPNLAQIEYRYVDSEDTEKKNISFAYQGRTLKAINPDGTLQSTENYSTNTGRAAVDYATNKRYGTGNMFYHPRWTDNMEQFVADCYPIQERCSEQIFTGNASTGGSGFAGTIQVLTGGLASVAIGQGGQNYVAGTVLTVAGDGTSGTAEIATVDANGAIVHIAVTNAGSGYTYATIDLTGLGDGNAKCSVAITGTREITGVTITSGGSGYINPNLRITNTEGVGAIFGVTKNSVGVITAISVVNGGAGYATNNVITFEDAVTPGAGALEYGDRYRLNTIIANNKSKLENLNDILSNCHGKYYFYEGQLRAYQDRPRSVNGVINQTNAHSFNYKGANQLSSTKYVYSKFNDPFNQYKQQSAYSEDFNNTVLWDSITGNVGQRQSKEVVAYGVDNYHEAVRYGRMIIEDERYQKNLLECVGNAHFMWQKPGDLLYVANSIQDETRHGGRIVQITGSAGSQVITLDEPYQFISGRAYYIAIIGGQTHVASSTDNVVDSFYLVNPNATTSTVSIWSPSSGPTIQITNDPNVNFSGLDPWEGCPYYIFESGKGNIYELVEIEENEDWTFKMLLRRYDESKFGRVDIGYYSGFLPQTSNWPTSYTEDSDH